MSSGSTVSSFHLIQARKDDRPDYAAKFSRLLLLEERSLPPKSTSTVPVWKVLPSFFYCSLRLSRLGKIKKKNQDGKEVCSKYLED